MFIQKKTNLAQIVIENSSQLEFQPMIITRATPANRSTNHNTDVLHPHQSMVTEKLFLKSTTKFQC